jgi:hypothetical protein
MHKFAILILFTCFQIIPPASTASAGGAQELSFLVETKVVVETISPDAKLFGVNAEWLQANTQAKLARNGIRVVANNPTHEASPTLFISLTAQRSLDNPEFLDYFIEMDLTDFVILESELRKNKIENVEVFQIKRTQLPKLVAGAALWRSGALGQARKTKLPAAIYRHADAIVDSFIQDYWRTRPKPSQQN